MHSSTDLWYWNGSFAPRQSYPFSDRFMFLFWLMGHECWIMNEKVRSQVQADEMGFLWRISGLTLQDKVKSADIRESLNIESLLLRLERSQMRWYGHVTQMSQKRTAKKLLCSTPIDRKPRGRPRTRLRDYVEDLSWSRLGIPAEHLPLLQRIEMLGGSNLSCCPRDPPRISGSRKLIDWLVQVNKKRSVFWSFRIGSFWGEALFLKGILFEGGYISEGGKGVLLFRRSGGLKLIRMMYMVQVCKKKCFFLKV